MMFKWRRKKDPKAAEEAKRYAKPIASRDFIIQTLKEVGQPMVHKDLAVKLKLTSAYNLEALRRRLRAMVRDGQLLCNKQGQYEVFHMGSGKIINQVIEKNHLPNHWPDAIWEQVMALNYDVSPQEGREDIRHLPLVTIDGEDARDFDDAVYCQPKAQCGWTLFVAIADVSYYVPLESPLDHEALRRGTSVYFPGKVLPMLPEALSNELCSLKPHVDRYCMVAELDFTAKGEREGMRFYPAIMHSNARLTYEKVAHALVHPDQADEMIKPVLHPVQDLYSLYQQLAKQRFKRGALEIDSFEVMINLDDAGEVQGIKRRDRNEAHKLIEECMLATNQAVAQFIQQQDADTLFRIHEVPSQERINNLRQYFSQSGIQLGGGEAPTGKDFTDALEQAKGRDDAPLLQMAVLRTMNQAVYTPDNVGHFGLAYEEYVQVTSPIRRYPDLIVHRVLRAVLNKKDPSGHRYQHETLVPLGEVTSMTERRAEDASREAEQMLKCLYMYDKKGECFEGVIATVLGFGFFVTINDLFVDGLVHITALGDDYYQYDEVRHQLVGERTRRVFKQGDAITIQVAGVNIDQGKLDFALVNTAFEH